jgi:tetratricopeptide (TPR) repeat protein
MGRWVTRFTGGILLSFATTVWGGVIDTVDIDDSKNPATIRIDFTIPLQYINHAPERQGDELQIQFRTLANNLFSRESEISDQQTVNAAPSRFVPLIDTRYQTDAAERGVLTLRFSRRVSYKVYPGSDRRHITIEVVTTNNPLKSENQAIKPAPVTRTGKPSRPTVTLAQHYVVNLESFLEGENQPPLKDIALGERHVVYTRKFPIEDRMWNRLRIGFFETRQQAEAFKKTLLDKYPGAWVAYASSEEINQALEQADILTTPVKSPLRRPKAVLPAPADEKVYALMEEARKAIAENNINHAIQLYTKVLRYPDNEYSRDALEFLGLARERNRQYAHAIREYQRYLELYPQGEGSIRVKQRLAGLTTAAEQPRTLSTGKKRTERATPWDLYGGFSQFYRRDESTTDAGGDLVTQSSLSNDLDITARKRSSTYDLQSRFTGSYLHDFLSDGPGSYNSISSLYIDGNQKQYGIAARLGRQSRNTGGVLGRFDGLLLGYQVSDWLTVNGVAGFPVFSTRDGLKTDRYLYGISADLGTFANAWDFETFFIEQQNDGILDRRAIGGEARYFDPTKSILSFVDYDISYQSLNTLIVLGTWTLADRTTFNASLDYRNSPVLTTTNAIQGQTLPNLSDLLDTLSEDEIRQLAEDRTADVTTVSVGASHPFTDQLQMSGDITVSNLSGTNASGGVEAIPGTGNEYFYNLQLIGSNLIKNGDISVLGLRYADTSTSNISTLTLDTRYPIQNVWRINPRFRVDYRDNSNNDSTQWIASPSLRIDYRWRRRYRFEVEGGGEWSTEDLPNDSQDSSSYFFSLGYRVDF